jgi:hypothetical protein
MTEKSSRREFLRSVSLAGAAVAIAGGAGCAKPPEVQSRKPQIRMENDSTIVIEDPELIAALDRIYHSQEAQGKVDRPGSAGIRTKFYVKDSTGENCPGTHQVNLLCAC